MPRAFQHRILDLVNIQFSLAMAIWSLVYFSGNIYYYYYLSLTLMVAFSVLVFLVRSWPGTVCLTALVLAVLGFAVCSLAVVATAAGLMILLPHHRWRNRLGNYALVVGIGLASGMLGGQFCASRIDRVTNSLSATSLHKRLAYELDLKASGTDLANRPSDAALDEAERVVLNYRAETLRALHHGYVRQRARSFGFYYTSLNDAFPGWSESVSISENGHPSGADSWHLPDMGTRDWHRELYLKCVFDFVHPLGIGYVVDHQIAVGFTPHGVHRGLQRYVAQRGVEVESIELISLRFEPPRVYLSSEQVRLDPHTYPDPPFRGLDGFEFEGLRAMQKMRTDLIVANDGTHTRMLGAIRLRESCLRCHILDRGEVIGALSFTIDGQ